MNDNPDFNILFVREIEKYKCLYDFNCTEYSNRDAQDRAWAAVSVKMEGTVDECKTRWKNLRAGLTRYLKSRSEAKRIKQYYLFDVMQFVIPFTKHKKQKSVNLPNAQFTTSWTEENELKQELEEGYLEQNETSQMSYSSGTQSLRWGVESSPTNDHVEKKIKKRKCPGSLEEAVITYFAQKTMIGSNPDMEFFKSLLPDIAEFNPSQKRRFKQRVLQIIEDISMEV